MARIQLEKKENKITINCSCQQWTTPSIYFLAMVVCYIAVFSVVTQRFSPRHYCVSDYRNGGSSYFSYLLWPMENRCYEINLHFQNTIATWNLSQLITTTTPIITLHPMSSYKHPLGMARRVLRDCFLPLISLRISFNSQSHDAYVVPTAKLWPQAQGNVPLWTEPKASTNQVRDNLFSRVLSYSSPE